MSRFRLMPIASWRPYRLTLDLGRRNRQPSVSKLPVLTPRRLIKKLKQAGFVLDHVSGSHYFFFRPSDGKRAAVPYHSKDIPPGTLNSILKSADLKREDL